MNSKNCDDQSCLSAQSNEIKKLDVLTTIVVVFYYFRTFYPPFLKRIDFHFIQDLRRKICDVKDRISKYNFKY